MVYGKKTSMVKSIIKFVCLLLSLSLLIVGCGKEQEVIKGDIIVLFTNDVHCGIDENIGYAGLASYKKEMEKKSPFVTLVDCGDHSQGNYIGSVSKGECIIEIMNKVGYDLAIPGNHEFDFGIENFAANIKKANAEYICCNLGYTGTDKTFSEMKPYVIKTYGKTKVAFIGISTPRTIDNSSANRFIENDAKVFDFMKGEDGKLFYAMVQENIDECKTKGADYIVALAHLGNNEEDGVYRSAELIKNTSGLDVLLDGHSHACEPCGVVNDTKGKPVLVGQTGTKLENIGQLVITDSGVISLGYISDYENKDEETEKTVNSVKEKYEKELGKIVVKNDYDLKITDADGIRMIRSREMPLGNLVADAYRVIAGADIGMVNGGGIRADLPKGNVTYADIISVNPFGNSLCVVEVTGSEIADMLEYFCSQVKSDYVKDGKALGEFGSFQQVSGLKFKVDTSVTNTVKTDDDSMFLSVEGPRRVSDITVLDGDKYVPIDMNKTYTLASHNYMIKDGGSGMGVMLADHKLIIDCGESDYQVLIDYITSLNGDLSAYQKTDGRIEVK